MRHFPSGLVTVLLSAFAKVNPRNAIAEKDETNYRRDLLQVP